VKITNARSSLKVISGYIMERRIKRENGEREKDTEEKKSPD